jgi:hypothetical protein
MILLFVDMEKEENRWNIFFRYVVLFVLLIFWSPMGILMNIDETKELTIDHNMSDEFFLMWLRLLCNIS